MVVILYSYRVNTYTNDYYYDETATEKFVDEIRDEMGLSFDSGTELSDAVELMESGPTYQRTTTSRVGSYSSGYTYTDTNWYEERSELAGSLEILGPLSNMEIMDLEDDWMLPFEVSARMGQFQLLGAELTANLVVDDRGPNGTPVPIVSTHMLLLAGLFAGGYRVRRVRQRAKAAKVYKPRAIGLSTK